MRDPSQPALRRRSIRLALALALALVVARIAWLLSSPSVDAVCEHVLGLATTIGEVVGEAERAHCREVMQARREAAGLRRWSRVSRCIVEAGSFDEAGGCLAG